MHPHAHCLPSARLAPRRQDTSENPFELWCMHRGMLTNFRGFNLEQPYSGSTPHTYRRSPLVHVLRVVSASLSSSLGTRVVVLVEPLTQRHCQQESVSAHSPQFPDSILASVEPLSWAVHNVRWMTWASAVLAQTASAPLPSVFFLTLCRPSHPPASVHSSQACCDRGSLDIPVPQASHPAGMLPPPAQQTHPPPMWESVG